MSNKYLSEHDLKNFKQDGFVVVRGMYGCDEMAAVSGWIADLANREPEIGKQMMYYEQSLRPEGGRILSRIEKFADFDQRMRSFIDDERMMVRVAELLGEPALLFKEKINFKMPGGDGFKAHQDIQPGWDDYCSYFISVLVTIDESTVENGCLELSRGHHTRGLIGRRWEPLSEQELQGVEFEKYPMSPGDVAFFDCFVPHQSAPNLTDKQRRNLYLTFNRASEGDHREKYFEDKRRSYPPDIERETNKDYVFRV